MHIAIIGTGQVGGARATGLAGTAHDVTLGARDPQAAPAAALAARTGAAILTPQAAAAQADIVVLALPWAAARAAVAGLGHLTGRIVVDCTPPPAWSTDASASCSATPGPGERRWPAGSPAPRWSRR